MRTFGVIVAALALASCSGGADTSSNGTAATKVDAGAAAKAEVARFHQLMDAGQTAEIYKSAFAGLRKDTPEQDFVDAINAAHAKMGNFKSAGDPAIKDYSGEASPQVVLTYDPSTFENGAVKETFTFAMVDGKPQLAAYDYKEAEAAPAAADPGANAEDGDDDEQ